MASFPPTTNTEAGDESTDQVAASATAAVDTAAARDGVDEAAAAPAEVMAAPAAAAEIAATDTLLRQENEEDPEEGAGQPEARLSTQQRLDNLLRIEEPRGAAGKPAHHPPSLVLGAAEGAAGGGKELTKARALSWLVALQRDWDLRSQRGPRARPGSTGRQVLSQ